MASCLNVNKSQIPYSAPKALSDLGPLLSHLGVTISKHCPPAHTPAASLATLLFFVFCFFF